MSGNEQLGWGLQNFSSFAQTKQIPWPLSDTYVLTPPKIILYSQSKRTENRLSLYSASGNGNVTIKSGCVHA